MKIFTVLLLIVVIAGCKPNHDFPLPPEAQLSLSACPRAAQPSGSCYSVPLTHKETLDWYFNRSIEEDWTYQPLSDDEPFSVQLMTTTNSLLIYFYRKPGDQSTGILIYDQ